MSVPRASTPGRLSTTNTGDNNDASYRTALQGALLAVQRTGPRQTSQSSAASRGLGQSLSASHTPVGRRSPTHPSSGLVSRDVTGNSQASSVWNSNYNNNHKNNNGSYDPNLNPATPQQQQTRSSHTSQALTPSHAASFLAPPGKSVPSNDVKSPSFIAATLAASRSNSPSPRQSQAHTPIQQQQATPRRRRMNSTGTTPSISANNSALTLASPGAACGTDETSLPSTNALISLFEKKDDTDPVKKKGHSRHHSLASPLAVKPNLHPATPPRALSPVLKNSASPSRQASAAAWRNSPSPAPVRAPAPSRSPEPRSPLARKEMKAVIVKKEAPTPPLARAETEKREESKHDKPLVMEKPRAGAAKRERPATPPPRTVSRSQTVILSPQPTRVPSQTLLSQQSPEPVGTQVRSKPPLPTKPRIQPPSLDLSPGRRRTPLTAKPDFNAVRASKKKPIRKQSIISTSSNDTFVSASSAPSPDLGSPSRNSRPPTHSLPRTKRPASSVGIATHKSGGSQHRQKPLPPPSRGPRHHASDIGLNSLTSAIMAGSLASARASPAIAHGNGNKARTPPTPPPRKPTPRLKKTLRQPPSKKSDDETNEQAAKYKKHRLRSNKKHSHHEGSRKRWRDEITVRERKRYEGVWASNRGRLLSSSTNGQGQLQTLGNATKEADAIANIVARDIWSRSRLPFDELAEVWELVDREGRGFLDKTEFVVGMWLVDQRLRGRKIPQKVSESVWGSAKGFEVVVGHPSGGRGKHHHHKRGNF